HDGEGRIMLLAPHGMHFSARLLTGTATATVEGEILVVRSGERWMPPARLRLSENAGYWSEAIAALG
ncbi:MAG TPA: hypothetical protein VK913_09315, partial [Erythrobacter sp.]|nr:hypothetical protein [Erythrobacter sp.]